MKGKVNCTCGWSWNKSDSSVKDMYVCHQCGRDNSNNMKNGGWLDNYNDSQASAPEGMVGDGFSNVGRNYSPAWGGQFEDGGEIPMAQNGTRADSLALYNNALAKIKFYKGNPDYVQRSPQTNFKSDELRKKLIKLNKNLPDKKIKKRFVDSLIQNTEDDNKPLTPAEKSAIRNQSNIVKFGPVRGTNLTSFGDILGGEPDTYFNPLAPPIYLHPNISPQGSEKYYSRRFGDSTEIPYYDPIAVAPFDIVKNNPKLLAERIKKYGTSGVPKSYLDKIKPTTTKETTKPKSNYWTDKDVSADAWEKFIKQHPGAIGMDPDNVDKDGYHLPIYADKQRPKVEALQSLQPIGIQNDFNIEASLPVIRPEAKVPKSYNVHSQRYNMKGPSDYYNYNREGISLEELMKVQAVADAYNADVEKRYGPQNEYRTPMSAKVAAERYKQLRQEMDITPNYQMGGNVYPVNYVPQAQNGKNKKKKGVQDLLRNVENSVNKSLGNPMQKAATAADQLAGKWYNPKTKQWEENDPVDNFRHPMAGRYTSEAIQDKLYNIPILSQIVGFTGSNALGVAHELSTLSNPKDKRGWYDKIRESGEDIFNNAVGATVGSLPISGKAKTNILTRLSNENMIPDGVSGKGGDMYIKRAMGGSIPQAQEGKKLNPFTYPKPDYSYSTNPFLVRDPQFGIFIGGVNPTYSTKDFSIGASMVGVGNKDFQKLPADYGIRGSYNPTDSLSINANLSKDNIGAGLSYRFQDGGSMFKKPSILQQEYIDPIYSYPERDLYPSEDEFLKENTHVGGMAAEDDHVIINPYSPLPKEMKDLVRINETARLAMRNGYPRPTFDLTPKQKEFYSTIQNGKPYSEDLQDIRETIAARIMTGDDSAQDYTKEQEMYADKLFDVLKKSKEYATGMKGMMKSKIGMAKAFEQDPKFDSSEESEYFSKNYKDLNSFQTGGSIPGSVGFTYARTQGIPSEGPYAKKTMPSAQVGRKIKIKDERALATKPAISTGVKKMNFDLMQSKDNKAYYDAVARQKAEQQAYEKSEIARKRLMTPKQIKKDEDDKLRQQIGEQYGTITQSVPETTWERAKAIVSNPMTAIGYKVRGENLPGRFQYGPRNPHDYAVDWINPLQSAAALSNIPGQLGRGEFLDAGLSALDAADLGIMSKGLKKVGTNKLRNLSPAMGFREGGIIDSDRGQWDYPGEITRINSNVITMKPDPKTGKPLTKPLLGISDTGDVKLMRPGGNYKFDGKRVTEYPIAQEGKDIKLKNKKGKVEIINTASPEYEKLYKAGEIQSPNAGEDDNPFFGGQLPEVVIQQQMTPLLRNKLDYGRLHNREDFINQKKDEYIKGLGKNNWYGTDRNNFPQTVLRDINAHYDYDRNTSALEKIAKQRGFDLNTRGNWIYDLTPSEREALINSKYSSQLNPNEFSEMASGIQQIGNTILPGQPFRFKIPGLTERELEEDRESWISPLKVFAPINMPGNAAANYLKNNNMSSYPQYRNQGEFDMPFLDAQRMGNVDVWDSMAMNPLTYAGAEGLINLPGAVAKGARTLATIGGENISNIKNAIPAVKEVVKELPKAIKKGEVPETVFRAMPDEFKQSPLGRDIQGTIDQREMLRNMKKDLQKTLDVEGRDQIRYDWVQGPWDLESQVKNMDRMFRRTLTDVGGKDLADIGINDMLKFQSESPAFKRFEEIVYQGKPSTEAEMQAVLKELADTMPKATNYTKEARKAITLRQKDLLYNKKDVKDLKAGIKATAKNTINKIKGKDTPDVSEAAPINYSPEEKGTLDTIKELGKYRRLFSQKPSLAKSHPETMKNVNDLILKLDDDVVRNVLGVGKQELINSYKNIAPNVKQAEANAAMAQKPFGLDELQAILPDESNNALRDLYANKYDAPYTSEPSLVSKINKRKAVENLGYEFEAPSSWPQELVHYVETSYDLKPPTDAAGNVIDANALVLKAEGNAKGQIKNAMTIVNEALPGENVIGAHNLSTDSYALTLDAALPYVKKGRIKVKVDVDPQVTNSMGYATRFPGLALKDINSKIEAIEKASGVKIPRAKYNKDYNEYEFPRIYFTKIQKNGGYIDRAKHGKQLVKLDQLTNFTNYNKPQPGGWLSKYE